MSNQYLYKVPFTEEQLVRDYFSLRMTQSEIATKYGTTQKVIWKAMKKMGLTARVAAKRDQAREKNSYWKGGRVLVAKKRNGKGFHDNGYFYILAPSHPNANKSGYVAEHIAVATKLRSRPLIEGEHVHHINLRKHDNRSENLIICTRSQHAIWHNQLEKLATLLLEQNHIIFDPTNGYLFV